MVKNNYNIKEPIVIPYNKKNKLIKDVNVKNILKKLNINVDITDIELYRKSLTHKSYIKKEYYTNHRNDLDNAKKNLPKNILGLRDQSNERLEFLGDTIIKAVVSHYLFERYPKEDEGFMTRLKTKIENQKSLARFARKIGIDEFIIISAQNEIGNIGRTNDKILEDAFESFLGALYLDCGFLVCKRFMRYI